MNKSEPTYKAIVALNEISFVNEFPKNMEKFIWGIPGKYESYLDREISAFCTCWIYDFTKKSFRAAMVMDSWMKGSPFEFISKREFDYFIMEVDQQMVLYKNIRYSDCYYFFDKLYKIISRCRSLKSLIDSYGKKTPFESALCAFKEFKPFSDNDMDSMGRVNLFLLMMTHMFGDYDYDGSLLVAPLFKTKILPMCKELLLLDRKTKGVSAMEATIQLTDKLKWISRKNPMTYWVGLATYNEFKYHNEKKEKKFVTMRIIRHPFKKK